MAYYAALGADVSPASIIQQDLARIFVPKIRAGASDADLAMLVFTGSISNNPCVVQGSNGPINMCTEATVKSAISMAHKFKKAADEAAKGKGRRGGDISNQKKLAMVAGIGLVALVVLGKPKKGR